MGFPSGFIPKVFGVFGKRGKYRWPRFLKPRFLIVIRRCEINSEIFLVPPAHCRRIVRAEEEAAYSCDSLHGHFPANNHILCLELPNFGGGSMRGGRGMCRRRSSGGGAGEGAGIFAGGWGEAGGVMAGAAHWLARWVVSPIFASSIFNPLNSALARETSPPTAAPMEGICREAGTGTVGRSRVS